jgi:hypothetical protein
MKLKIIFLLSLLFIISITILLIFFRDVAENSFAFEVGKAVLQVGVIAIMGAVVSVLIYEYQLESQKIEKQRDREQKSLEYREALLMSTLLKATNAYSQAKKARRLIRARAIVKSGQEQVVLADQYDQYLDMINDAQLDLENLRRDVDTSAKAFTQADVIGKSLRSMEKYLNKLVREYEETRGCFSDVDLVLPIYELPKLSEFIQQAKDSQFKPRMIKPYRDVQKNIREDLLYPNLPD